MTLTKDPRYWVRELHPVDYGYRIDSVRMWPPSSDDDTSDWERARILAASLSAQSSRVIAVYGRNGFDSVWREGKESEL